MNEKNNPRKRRLVPAIAMVVLILGGSLLVYWWLMPTDSAVAFMNVLRQDANRVGEKIASDSRLRRNIRLNEFEVDVVYPMFDEEKQTLIAPRIEFEGNDAKLSELAFTVYHDTNGNFVADEDEPDVKWSATNISGKQGEVFTLENQPVDTKMLDAAKAGGNLRFSCLITTQGGGTIETQDTVQIKE